MICSNCERELPFYAMVCVYCGSSTTNPQTAKTEKLEENQLEVDQQVLELPVSRDLSSNNSSSEVVKIPDFISLKLFRPIVMLILSALWCALVWYVQQEVGTQGTASLFALVAYAVGTPGIIAVASIQCLAFFFIAMGGPSDDSEPGGIWILYCFLCWAGCIVLSCVLPITFVLKDSLSN